MATEAPIPQPGGVATRWGILGAGRIAGTFARGLRTSAYGRLVAVAARDRARAAAFAAGHGADRACGAYADLLADPEVDAVYIATVHPTHHVLAVQAARAGKHLLVEKPLAVNHVWAREIIRAAREAGVFLAEAYMYRFHPRTRRLGDLVADGAVGEVLTIDASFAFRVEESPAHRLMNPDTAGGGILDVGGYPVSMSRLVAGAAVGRAFADPVDVTAVGTLGATGVDEWSVARLDFDSGVYATVSAGVRAAAPDSVRVLGSKGHLLVPNPWLPGTDVASTLLLSRVGHEPEEITIAPVNQYAREADAVARRGDRVEAPEMSWADSLGNAVALDAWRAQLGLRYPFEA